MKIFIFVILADISVWCNISFIIRRAQLVPVAHKEICIQSINNLKNLQVIFGVQGSAGPIINKFLNSEITDGLPVQ